MQQGIEKEKIEIARKLLASQMDMSNIAAVTGLSIDEIEQLKKEDSGTFLPNK